MSFTIYLSSFKQFYLIDHLSSNYKKGGPYVIEPYLVLLEREI